MQLRTLNVGCFGGGTGLPSLLGGLKSNPWLIVHGSEDEAVALREGERLAAAAPPARTRFLPVAGAGHTFGAAHPWSGSTPELGQVMDATLGFLAAELS